MAKEQAHGGNGKDSVIGALLFKTITSHILTSQYEKAIDACKALQAEGEEMARNHDLLFILAQAHMGLRQFENAVEVLNTAIDSGCDTARYYTLKAQALMYLGHHRESLIESDNAISRDANKVGAYVFKGQALKHLYRDKEALEAFAQGTIAAKHLPHRRDVKLDIEKAYLARCREEFDQAIKYSNYVIKSAPEYSSGYVHLGINLLSNYMKFTKEGADGEKAVGLLEKAKAALEKALELNSNDSISIYHMGILFELTGNIDEAAGLYQKAADISSGYTNPVIALVNIQMSKGEFELASRNIDLLLQKNPNSEEALLLKVRALVAEDNLTGAETYIDQLISINPENHYYYYRKALIQSAKGENESSLDSCEHALAIKPDDVDVLHQQSIVLCSLKRYSESLAMIAHILEIKPDFAAAYQAKGYVLSEAIKAEESFDYYYRTHVPDESKSGVILDLLDKKDYTQAETYYYNKITAENIECVELLDFAYEKMDGGGELGEVITLLKQAIAINPNFVLAYLKLSEVENKLSHPDQAAEAIKMASSIFPEYTRYILEQEKLPFIITIEDEALVAHQRAIEIDNSNPIFFSSKASTLGKFHRIEGMIESIEAAEKLLAAKGVKKLVPEQHDYLQHQVETRVELLKEVKNLVESVQSLLTIGAGGISRYTGSEDKALIEATIRSTSPFAYFPSMRSLGLPEEDIDVYGGVYSREESTNGESEYGGESREGATPRKKFGFYSAAKSLFHECASDSNSDVGEIHVTVGGVGSLSIRNIDDDSLIVSPTCSQSDVTKSYARGAPQHIKLYSAISSFAVQHQACESEESISSATMDQFSATDLSQASTGRLPAAYGDAAVGGGTSRRSSVSETLAFSAPQSPYPTSSASSELGSADGGEYSLKTESASAITNARSVLTKALDVAADECATVKQLQEMVAMLKDVVERNARLEAQIETIKRDYVRAEEVKYAIAHDFELMDLETHLKVIEAKPSLFQYYSGFVTTFQKYFTGFLARDSGEVATKSFVIPGKIFLPPLVEKVVSIFETTADFVLHIREDNEVTRALHCTPDIYSFLTKTIQKVACQAANNKAIEIMSLKEKEHVGIFKLMLEAKDAIFEKEHVSVQMELGASDAIKLLAAFRGGKIIIDSLTEDKAAVDDMLRLLLDDSFNRSFITTLMEKMKEGLDTIHEQDKEAEADYASALGSPVNKSGNHEFLFDSPSNATEAPPDESIKSTPTATVKKISHWYDFFVELFFCCFSCCAKIQHEEEDSIVSTNGESTETAALLGSETTQYYSM